MAAVIAVWLMVVVNAATPTRSHSAILVRLAGIEPTTLGFGGLTTPVVFFRLV